MVNKNQCNTAGCSFTAFSKKKEKQKKAKNFLHVYVYVFALPFKSTVDFPVLLQSSELNTGGVVPV